MGSYKNQTYKFLFLQSVISYFEGYTLKLLSNTLTPDFCVDALERALSEDRPEIFNSDQGSQFTSDEFTAVLKDHRVEISMDGRGRVFDNIFIERLWRTVKYEEIYLYDYSTISEARKRLHVYFEYYNTQRYHQSLGYRTPREVYYGINKNYQERREQAKRERAKHRKQYWQSGGLESLTFSNS